MSVPPLTAPDAPTRPDPIAELRLSLAQDLAAVDAEIDRVLNSETELTREVGRYVRQSKGKQLRPILNVLASGACGKTGIMVHQTAAALEIVHNATLLHDDVIDKSQLRRGHPTVNARFGDDVAILMADYLYSNAFELALNSLKPEVLRFITKVTSAMCEGEMFQIEKRGDVLTEPDYYRIIKAKTAYLFSACCGLGGVLGDANKSTIESLASFGMEFGHAFQITDDVLDYVAKDDHFGKTLGTDISGGKQTLPFIHVLEKSTGADRDALLGALGDASRVPWLVATVTERGGIGYALKKAQTHARTALSSLNNVPTGRMFGAKATAESLQRLRDLADFIVERTY